jgi:hypothetical protein
LDAQLRQLTERSSSSHEEPIDKLLDERIAHALLTSKLDRNRSFVLTAHPEPRTRLKTVFQSSKASIKRLLEEPPALRYGGWGLGRNQPEIVRGELIRAVSEGYRIIDIYEDGMTIFAVVADDAFLAWGQDKDPAVQKINPIALIEVIYNFVVFYEAVLNDLTDKPERVSIRTQLRNMHSNGVRNHLAPYGVNTFGQAEQGKPAPEDDASIKLEFKMDSFEARRVAFEIVRRIYLWFGFEDDKIPYSKQEEGIRVIDPDVIAGL